jgi:hypothetical protein
MQRRATGFLVLLLGLGVLATDARGHHNSNAFYDFSRVAEVEGRVANVKWSNPHVIVEIMAVNKDGVEQLWKIEGDSINALQRKGVDPGSVKSGDRVKVLGATSRRGLPEMFAAVFHLADGREVVLSDGIAVRLGLLDRRVSTGERISNTASANTPAERQRWIFRVWSRDAGDSYPRPSPSEPLRYTPAALAARAAWDPVTDDTGLQCKPQGMPGVVLNPYPIEFVDQGDEIILRIEEWDTVRTIHMTRDAAADVPATLLGHSVGRWEGDTLIVRTTDISWPYFDDVGTPQSAALVVDERFTLTENGSRLDYVQTATDPLSFEAPAVQRGYFWLEAGAAIKPYNCQLPDQPR